MIDITESMNIYMEAHKDEIVERIINEFKKEILEEAQQDKNTYNENLEWAETISYIYDVDYNSLVEFIEKAYGGNDNEY